jgi:phosphatidylglycerophosphate synthase
MKISLRKVFLIILFSGIFYMSLRPIIDPDFWWHLRTGQLMEQTRAILRVDPFSWTAVGKPWITHEWLSELYIFQIFKLGGYQLLTVTFSMIISASYLFSYLRCPTDSKPYVAGFSVLIGAIASTPLWGVRPQMITLLFTSFFLYLLDRYRQSGQLKLLVPLPLIMLIWVNLHAAYILGIAVILTYILGWAIELVIIKFGKKEDIDKSAKQKFKILVAMFCATVLLMPLNPSGFRIFTYPFETLFDPAMQKYIQEWLSPNFHDLMWQPLALLLLALIGAGMLGKHRISITKILLTLGFGFAALRSQRHVPLFAVAVIPVLAEEFSSLIKIKPTTPVQSRLFRWVNMLLVGAIVLIMIFTVAQLPVKQQEAEAANYPEGAVEWIFKNKPEGKMFNSYNWGGYLIWRLYPDYPVSIDGRADLYGEKMLTNYFDIYTAKSGWEEKLRQENIRYILVETDSRLKDAIEQSSNWKTAYKDSLSVIFTSR